MNSWLVCSVFGLVAVLLGLVGYHFSTRTLRWVAFVVALAAVLCIASYGLVHPARKPGSLISAFSWSADEVSSALIRPLALGHYVPAPGRVGWLVIVVLLVLGYRGLEAWTLHRQAPCLDVAALASDRQDNAGKNAQTRDQKHDWLVAELKFRLPAVEVRSPAILPGGSRSGGLASIAEATGVSGAGLAGAVIRFFGMIWPNPSRIQVRAWVEQTSGSEGIDDVTRVTVGLADPRTGVSIGTKTLAAGSLDDAVAAVAGYVARHIFARDPTVPPWSTSATDGADLAALLRARQVRGYPECSGDVHDAWGKQIEILESAAGRDLCAGVVRYELAQLYELCGTRRPVEALLLHAANREQYPRFYRGRYRLAMSLEMLANPHFRLDEIDIPTLREALEILDRCQVTGNVAGKVGDSAKAGLPDELRRCLLDAAQQELSGIEQYLTWPNIIWGSLRRRNERAVLRPYRQARQRQAFHDGVCVALLLVAVRQAQLSGAAAAGKLRHPGKIAGIAAAISGDSTDFAHVLPGFPDRRPKQSPITARLRTRRPGRCSTPSWTAAYNLACAYAAIAARAPETELDFLVRKVVRSLEFAVCNPECEMERPSEWIRNDPDFGWLRDEKKNKFTTFLHAQRARDYPAEAIKWPELDHSGPSSIAGTMARRAQEQPPMAQRRSHLIFISYRGSDQNWATELVYARMTEAFGADGVFKAGNALRAGEEFPTIVKREAASCPVMLACIGPEWLTVTAPDGSRRLDSPADWVQEEIAISLQAGNHVVPLLIGNRNEVALPKPDQLPESIRAMVYRQALWLAPGRGLDATVPMLIDRLVELVPELAERRRARSATQPASLVQAPRDEDWARPSRDLR